MDKDLQVVLEQGIKEIDDSLCTDSVIKRLVCLYDQITLFNPAYGLVNASGRELVVKHILDCLAPVEIIRQFVKGDSKIADLGSGSGLPGLVLASVIEGNSFFLVERMGRRCQFLRNTVVRMKLAGRVNVVESDISGLKERYDVITFRAFRQMKDIALDLSKITEKDSVICSYKSSEENIKEDINACRNIFSASEVRYSVPLLDARRSLLVLKPLV